MTSITMSTMIILVPILAFTSVIKIKAVLNTIAGLILLLLKGVGFLGFGASRV